MGLILKRNLFWAITIILITVCIFSFITHPITETKFFNTNPMIPSMGLKDSVDIILNSHYRLETFSFHLLTSGFMFKVIQTFFIKLIMHFSNEDYPIFLASLIVISLFAHFYLLSRNCSENDPDSIYFREVIFT
jgi:hypothetical protein